ncbi:MAG: carboxylesterase/lipase family protein [Proteobacteria bacterium]|jgi:para-nitrobenzyl esterase|nr:carboxylesterase/lipase family protein [Pseudomonadota bacterium]
MTVITTSNGPVAGLEREGVLTFKGIPYAAAPVGDLRWGQPRAPQPWQDPLPTESYGPQAIQNAAAMDGLFGGPATPPETSEDCLSLNVWAPVTTDAPLPVMVWIHGGAFTMGSGGSPVYDGTTFARRGIVLVSINYRLGALGFLRLTDLTKGAIPATGSEGIVDQVFALQWVQDNIHAFGGDPNNVTIFGESAGGMSVGALLGMPSAQPLFHKAIPQSGAGHTAVSAERATRVAALLLEELGIAPDDVQALYSVSADRILAAQQALEANAGKLQEHNISGMAFQPCIDGEHIPDLPFQSIGAGIARGKPVLIGNTLEENKLFTNMAPGAANLDDGAARASLGSTFSPDEIDRLMQTYAAALKDRGDEPSPLAVLTAINTDRMFRMPALRLAEAQAGHSDDVYVYQFNWKTDFMGGALGACHALEIPYVFASHRTPGLDAFAGSGQPGADALAEAMQSRWIAFARTGKPGADVAPYASGRTTIIFDADSRIEQDPNAPEREVWSSLEHAFGTM